MVSEPTAVRIISQNFMPVLSIRGRAEIRLGSFISLAGGLLAGPWAPLDIPPDEGQLPPVNVSSSQTQDITTPTEELDARAAAEAEQELDALLADDSPALASSDAELDAALASMEKNINEPPSNNEDDMDPSLAELLSKL
jgi:hypothetical protein